MIKTKVLYITNKIPVYRKSLYERLGEKVDLTIAHYGDLTSSKLYNEKIIETKKSNFFLKFKTKFDYEAYDVVIFWANLKLTELYKLALAKNRTFKLILFGTGVSASYSKKYDSDWKYAFILKKILDRVDAAIFYDNYPVIKYCGKGVVPSKLFCAPNTVDVRYDNTQKRSNRDSFIFFGTLYKEKGIHILLSAYQKLYVSQSNKTPILHILGDGSEFDKIKQWIKDNNLEHQIKLYGRVTDRATIQNFFSKAIACISPKQAGLSVLESMAYGVPFITTKYPITGGEYTSIVESSNGFFFDGTTEDLTKLLLDLINSPYLEEYSKNAYEYYSRFRSPDLWLSQVLRAINYAKGT